MAKAGDAEEETRKLLGFLRSHNLVAIERLTGDTDKSLNEPESGVLPALARTLGSVKGVADELDVDMDAFAQGFKTAAEEMGLTLEELRKRTADPRFDQLLTQVVSAVAHLDGTAAQIELASKKLPETAEALAKISKTSSKFSKAYWVARILKILVPLIP